MISKNLGEGHLHCRPLPKNLGDVSRGGYAYSSWSITRTYELSVVVVKSAYDDRINKCPCDRTYTLMNFLSPYHPCIIYIFFIKLKEGTSLSLKSTARQRTYRERTTVEMLRCN